MCVCVCVCVCLGYVVVFMKTVSYNVRGLGGCEKKVEVRRLLGDKKPFVVCLQESKLGVVDDRQVMAIWGDSSVGYSFQPSRGASGGLLTALDRRFVDVWSTSSFPHVLVIRGRVLETNHEFVLANVYAPYDTTEKQVLWNQLLLFIDNNREVNLCVCGDFNYVRFVNERKGRGVVFCQHDTYIFNKS